jgi:hypothetical protein
VIHRIFGTDLYALSLLQVKVGLLRQSTNHSNVVIAPAVLHEGPLESIHCRALADAAEIHPHVYPA